MRKTLREYEEALRFEMITLGKDHPVFATTRSNMCSVYRKCSKFADALREYEEALRIEIVTLGKNHPEVATTRINMGSVYRKSSKFAGALREYEEVLPYLLDRMLQTGMDFLLHIRDL